MEYFVVKKKENGGDLRRRRRQDQPQQQQLVSSRALQINDEDDVAPLRPGSAVSLRRPRRHHRRRRLSHPFIYRVRAFKPAKANVAAAEEEADPHPGGSHYKVILQQHQQHQARKKPGWEKAPPSIRLQVEDTGEEDYTGAEGFSDETEGGGEDNLIHVGSRRSYRASPSDKRHFKIDEDLSSVCHVKLPFGGIELFFNPYVTFISLGFLWAFVMFVVTTKMYEDGDNMLQKARRYVSSNFTWLYVASQTGWTIFIIFVFFSKFGNIKLGRDEDGPEYNFLTWFSMMFSAGIGITIFFFCVSGTIQHYTKENRFTANFFIPDNELAQLSINYSLFHLGLYGWVVYCLVGLLLGILIHREGLPMAMKSAFYPLIGMRIFGWLGDMISIVSATTTILSIATSLAYATVQVITGLRTLSLDIPHDLYLEVNS